MENSQKEWLPITAPGQVKVGTKLRFTIGSEKYSETAKLILHAGTDEEEIIYNKRQNYYLITSMCMENKGSQKNVEYLADAPAEQKAPCPECESNYPLHDIDCTTGRARCEAKAKAKADSRAAFEAHFGLTLRQALRTQDGSAYQMSNIQDKWEGWQAAKGEAK